MERIIITPDVLCGCKHFLSLCHSAMMLGNNVGIHRQPLTVALSATKRAVVSEISITTYSMLPYAVAYPFAVPVTTTSASEVFVYWSDLASHRIYRSTVSGSNIEVVMEDVHNVYSLLLVDKSSAPSQEPESSEDQFLFYTEANRGILGRLAVSSGSRLAGGAYVGHQHSVDNVSDAMLALYHISVVCFTLFFHATRVFLIHQPGSENNNTNVILLKGLSDPRGISAQSHRGKQVPPVQAHDTVNHISQPILTVMSVTVLWW